MIARPFILRRRRRKSFETMRERQTLQTTLSIAGPLSKENYSLRLPDSTTVGLGVIGYYYSIFQKHLKIVNCNILQ